MTTLLPLMQSDNPIETIKYGAWALASLSENKETHEKILKSRALPTLGTLISKNLHYNITKYCIETLSNLCENFENFEMLLELKILSTMVCNLLDNVENECQAFIMKIVYNLSIVSEYNLFQEKMHKTFMKSKYLERIVRCCASSSPNVAEQSLKVLK
jgi:hypothetical protein